MLMEPMLLGPHDSVKQLRKTQDSTLTIFGKIFLPLLMVQLKRTIGSGSAT